MDRQNEEIVFEIDQGSVARYFTLGGVLLCLIFTVFYGIGILLAILYWILIASWLSSMQAEAMKYRLDGKNLRVDQGVFFLSRKAIPLDRITDLALVQGPLLRFCGLWALRVQTAGKGTEVAEATLYGLLKPEEVREKILTARDAYIEPKKQ